MVAIFAGVNGYLDAVPVSDVRGASRRSSGSTCVPKATIYAELRDKRELSDELTERLHAEAKKVADGFYVEASAA